MPDPLLVNLGCGHAWHAAWRNFDLAPAHPSIEPVDLTAPLPLADNSADAVYHAHVLEHLSRVDAARLLRECHRILKPGGILRVVVPDLELHARNYLNLLDGDDVEHDWGLVQLIDQMVRTRSEGEMGAFLRNRAWRDRPRVAACVLTEFGAPPSPPRRRLWRTYFARLRFAVARMLLSRRERIWLEEARFRASGEVHRWMYDRRSLQDALRDAGFSRPIVQSATQSLIAGFAGYHLDVRSDGAVRHPDSLYVEGQKA